MTVETTINPSLSYEYSNSLHAQFNDRMHSIVGGVAPTLINLPADIFNNWRTFINLEIEINAEIAANVETSKIADKDKERDTLSSYLFEDVKNQTRSPFPEKKEAAEHLMPIINKFQGLQSKSNDVETSEIKSLITDLRSSENVPHCTTLGLDELIALLETSNSEFDALKSGRTTKRTESKLPQSKDVRKQTDELYNKVCKIIEVAVLLAASEDDKKNIIALINEMNQYIAETKTSFKQSQAAKEAAEKKKEEEEKAKEDANTEAKAE